jgi:hypothetical protein
MCKTKLGLVVVLLGSMIAALPSSETNAEGAPVPVRKEPPPPAGQPQPTPASVSSTEVQITLSCGDDFSILTGGVTCRSLSDNSGLSAIMYGLNGATSPNGLSGAMGTTSNSAFEGPYLVCTYSKLFGLFGSLTGVSSTPVVNGQCAANIPPNSPLTKTPEASSWCGGTFVSTNPDRTCLVLFKHIQPVNLSGWYPAATQLVLFHPTPPQPAQAQTPAGAQPASPASSGGTVTLHCGVAGLSVSGSLFSSAGLSCPDPITPGKCAYVILAGYGPPAGYNWDHIDFTISVVRGGTYTGYYTGISADPKGNVTYGSADGTQLVFSKFPTVAGIIPQNSELIVRGPMICL